MNKQSRKYYNLITSCHINALLGTELTIQTQNLLKRIDKIIELEQKLKIPHKDIFEDLHNLIYKKENEVIFKK